MPHFFYKMMERTLVGRTKLNQLLFFACERLMYTPIFQALSLYFLAIFEVIIDSHTFEIIFNSFNLFMGVEFSLQGNSHDVAVANLMSLYWRVLKANWTYLSLIVFINIRYVPPIVSESIIII